MKRLTTKEFIEKAKAIHGEKYDYTQVEYVNDRIKVFVICAIHGEFKQSPNRHLQGDGCPECGKLKSTSSRMLTEEEFILKGRTVHGDRYTYEDLGYKNTQTKVKIICHKHGAFFQKANDHLAGRGCGKCGRESAKVIREDTQDSFLAKAKVVHGDKYDYSLTKYTRSTEKVLVVCKEHGEFYQKAGAHIKGRGCQKCSNSAISRMKTYSHDGYVERAVQVHGDRYDYSVSRYVESKEKMAIGCREHGNFYQQPFVHLLGHGCPSCSNIGPSKGEIELADYIASLVAVERSDRKLIAPFEIDVIAPEKNIGVEYCGAYYHSDKFKEDEYHLNKLDQANAIGYELIQVFDDEWYNKQDIVKSVLKNRLGFSERKEYARNTTVKIVSAIEARSFLEANHIQGYVNAEIRIGLYRGKELLMLATFSKHRKTVAGTEPGWYELVRLCSSIGAVVVGGFSKLLKAFCVEYAPRGIKTYCDRRYFNGNGYEAVGFVKTHNSAPNYYYIGGAKRERYSRYGFQKHKLKDKLPVFDERLSEKENMKNNGYLRVYDCGNAVYKMDLSSPS